jgi:Na+-driven multidrug efflux pump
MGAQMLVVSLSGVLMIRLVNRYGVDTSAAFNAATQAWNYIMMPAFAVGMAVSAMAAQNVGAQKWDRVRATARVGVLYAVVLTGSVVLLIELLNKYALGFFLPPGSAALEVGSHINRVVTWSFIFFGVSMVLFGVVRATGAVMVPLLILTLTLLLVRFPAAAMLQDKFGADAIWWSFPISSALAAVLAVVYYKYGGWRAARMLPNMGGAAAGTTAGAAASPLSRRAPSAESATGT